jgi:hypothetical protein
MTEHQEQVSLLRWVTLLQTRHPELALLHAIPNGGHRHKAVAARMKAEGVKRGVPDLCLPVPRGEHHGLYLEMKTRQGRLSPEQREWGNALQAQGYRFEVCRSWHEAARSLADYLDIRCPGMDKCRGRQDAVSDDDQL